MKVVVSIDWGGTFVKLGVFSLKGRLLLKDKFSSRSFSLPAKFFPALDKFLHLALEKLGLSYKDVKAAALGAPGIIDVKKAFIYYLPNIKGWENFSFRKEFSRHFSFPLVAFDNDANLAAWGEYCQGALKKSRNAILLTLGTGIGCGLIIRRRLFSGITSAGEGGHIAISLRGPKCSCGASGCVESFLGSNFFLNEVKNNSSLREVKSLKELSSLAKSQNQKAKKYWEYYGRILGVFIAGLINLLNPEIIALGGGVSAAFDLFYPALEKEVAKRAMRPQRTQVKICRAALGNQAGIFGGFWLAKPKIK